MTRSELKIGNLFNVIQRHLPVHLPSRQIFMLVTIELFDVGLIEHGKHIATDATRKIPIRDLSPIHLSEFWLERMGFFKLFKDGKYVWINRQFIGAMWHVDLKGDGFATFNTFGSFLTEIKYVHELQNLYFALTKDDLL